MLILFPIPRANAIVAFATMSTLFFLFCQPSLGQDPPRFGRVEDTETNVDAYHYLVRPGVATVEVSAFGNLVSPGVYVLEEGVNLAFLLALTGGPNFFNQPDIKISTTIRLFRNRGGTQSLVFEAPFEEVMNEADNTPVLSEGDIVTVEVVQKRKLVWRDIFTVAGPILSTLILVDQLTNRN